MKTLWMASAAALFFSAASTYAAEECQDLSGYYRCGKGPSATLLTIKQWGCERLLHAETDSFGEKTTTKAFFDGTKYLVAAGDTYMRWTTAQWVNGQANVEVEVLSDSNHTVFNSNWFVNAEGHFVQEGRIEFEDGKVSKVRNVCERRSEAT